MRTLFLTVAEATAAKNLLRGSFWRSFRKDLAVRVILITSPDKRQEYEREFGERNVIVEALTPQFPSLGGRLRAFIARNALRTGTVTLVQMRDYYTRGNAAALAVKRILWRFMGRSKILQRLLRYGELFERPSGAVRELFDRYRPDGVFSTIAINDAIDLPVLREARRRKIKTVGMLRGWDNFTSHGFLRVLPDTFLLQNRYLKDMGAKYQFLRPETMEVVGWPQNDWFFRKDLIEPRDVFLKRLGIDPAKRMVLFGAMGDFLFPKEGEIAEVFEELVEQGKIPRDLVMLFRAHPAFLSPLEKIKSMRHVVPDRGARYSGGKIESWEMGEKEMTHLINSIIHSEMVITSGSTMALDAIALGKPAISAAFEKTPMPYWFSGKRFRDHYTHYEDMMKTRGVRRADSPEELARAINEYLVNPQKDGEGRKKLRQEFLEPQDGQAGKRTARIVRQLFGL